MIEALAPTLVANFLLPYVKDGLKVIAEKVAKSAGEAAGEEAASVTRRVWSRVKGLFDAHPEHEEVLQDFREDPDATAVYLAKRLAKLLEANPEAAEELSALAETPTPGSNQSITSVIGNSGVTITVAGSNVSHSSITGIKYSSGREPDH